MDKIIIYVLCCIGIFLSFVCFALFVRIPFNPKLSTLERTGWAFLCFLCVGVFVVCMYFLIDILIKQKKREKNIKK